MLNPKVKLADLKVKSFVSTLEATGTFSVLQSRRNSLDKYTWKVTVIDTQA